MKYSTLFLCAALIAAAASIADAAPPSGRKLYKWVDEQGLTHYGDRIPPEYAAQEQHLINAQGIETGRIEAQKSADQLAAEDQQRALAEQRAARDKNLLNTYASVPEIERLRDQRLGLIADQVKVTAQYLDVLDGRLKQLRITSQQYRPYSDNPKAPPMLDQVAEDLVRVDADIRTQRENLRTKRDEATAMTKQFESDIARFKELRGIH